MGKSTFISHILATKGNTWFEDSNYLVVHLDADKNNRHQVPKKIEAVENLYNKILNELFRISKENKDISYKKIQHIDDSSAPSKESSHRIESWLRAVASLIELINRSFGKEILLFIDNLDYLYHINDRAHFSKKKNVEAKEAKDFIEYMIDIFSEGANGALTSAGIKVIFSLRPDSLSLLQSNVHLLANHAFNNEDNIFFYNAPSTYEVLLGRYRLLKHITSLIKVAGKEKRMTELMSVYDKILTHYKKSDETHQNSNYCSKNLFQRLASLSKQGLRQILEHMSNYSWIGDENLSELDERFAYQTSPSMLTFTTGGKRYFSQFHSAFPNFYLVDSSVASILLKSQGFSEDILCKHRHTYWLKRLIAEYVYAKGDCVLLREVLDVFSDDSDDQTKPNGYEESIVRLSAASLCQTDRSNVMVAELDVSADGTDLGIGELRITERGKYCLECYIDTFQYLQLIVDDYMLSFPKCIENHMYYKKDYQYLIFPQPDYHKHSSLMVSIKARQVFLFLKVLEISLEMEKKLYPNVFLRLSSAGIKIPDVNQIEKNVIKSLDTLRKYLNLNHYEEYMREAKNDEHNIRKGLEGAYAIQKD